MRILQNDEETRRIAGRIISLGGIVAFRTDTFYGLGADPFNRPAIRNLNALKGREGKPVLLIIADAEESSRFFKSRNYAAKILAQNFWPGPLTIVAAARPEVPEELTAGTDTIGLRLPDSDGVRELVRACGGALTATSANIAGREPAKSASAVAEHFPSGVDLIIDEGEVSVTQPSTVAEATRDEVRLIREGLITKVQLEQALSGTGAKLV